MELRQLRYFVAVARELHFTKAAEKLHLAQPALSRQIHQLEDELGVRLFERNSRATRLTDAGAVFFAEAQALLAQSDQAIRVAQATEKSGRAHLNVGYVWGLFHSLVPRALARFRQALPHVSVHLFDMTATQQAEALTAGHLDVGFIGFTDEPDGAALAKRRVGACKFVAVLPNLHPLAAKQKISLAALAEDFFIVISKDNYPGAARFVAEACERAGFRPRILQTAERGHTILSLVAGNCGVALLPAPLEALPHPGVVFRPLTKSPKADLFLAWVATRRSRLIDALVALFGNCQNEMHSVWPARVAGRICR